MDSRIAIFNMQDGIPMKRRKYPEIWYWDNERKTIMIKYPTGHTDEKLFAMNDQDHIDYVFEALYAIDWYPADEADRSKLGAFYFLPCLISCLSANHFSILINSRRTYSNHLFSSIQCKKANLLLICLQQKVSSQFVYHLDTQEQ